MNDRNNQRGYCILKILCPRFIWQDLLIVLVIVLNVGANFLTHIFLTTITGSAAAANQLESNPVQRTFISLGYVQFIIQGALYAILVVFYLHIRRNKDKNYLANQTFTFITLFLFLLVVADFVNDLGIVLGLLL